MNDVLIFIFSLIAILIPPVLFVFCVYKCCGCKHDWQLIEKYDMEHRRDGLVYRVVRSELYQCSKCKKFKKISIDR